MLGYFSRTLSVLKREKFSESEARGKLWAKGTDNLQGQISEHIFAPNEKPTIVFINRQIIFATRAALKIREYPVLAGVRRVQSCNARVSTSRVRAKMLDRL